MSVYIRSGDNGQENWVYAYDANGLKLLYQENNLHVWFPTRTKPIPKEYKSPLFHKCKKINICTDITPDVILININTCYEMEELLSIFVKL